MRPYLVIRNGHVWLVEASAPEHALGKVASGSGGYPLPGFEGVVAASRVTAPTPPPRRRGQLKLVDNL